MGRVRSVIAATGSFVPPVRVPNDAFLAHEFWGPDGKRIAKTNRQILDDFEAITGIQERRYVADDQVTSDMAALAALSALESSGVDKEQLDYIIVAHNFGDVRACTGAPDLVPALAARVKARLQIVRPHAVALDVVFGCPGWLQGVIQADYMIRSGDVRRVMVIGADTLSRVSDPHDRDSMIYSDGAGAVILEGRENGGAVGILSHAVRSDALEHSSMLSMGPSNRQGAWTGRAFLKMEGRKLYRYALQTVAGAITDALEKAGVRLAEVRKVLLHQANGKMDEAILGALYQLHGMERPPADVMPMTISWLGNSSVATLPTLLDLILKGSIEGHALRGGDVVVLASVGAGMHINAVVYRMP